MSLGKLGSLGAEIERARDVDAFVARGISLAMLEEMDTDHSGDVDRGEFLKYVLLAMGTTDPEDIAKALSMFDALDENKSGRIELKRARGELRLARSFTSPTERARDDRGEVRGLAAPLLSTATA